MGIPGPYSYSRLRKCQECLFSAKLRYIDGIKQLPTNPTHIGSNFHKAAELYVKALIKNNLDSSKELINLAEQFLRSNLSEGAFEEIKWPFRKTLNDMSFPAHVRANLQLEPEMAVDCRWQPVDYNDPKAYFRAKIDLLHIIDETRAEIWDYKSGRVLETFVNKDAKAQLLSYCAMVRAKYPKIQKFLVKNKYIRYGIDVPAIVESWEVDDIIRTINARISMFSTVEEYPAQLQSDCETCEFRKLCPTWMDYEKKVTEVALQVPGHNPSLHEMVPLIFVASKMVTDYKDKFQKFINDSEKPCLDDPNTNMVYTNIPKLTKSVNDQKGLFEYLRDEAGIEEKLLFDYFTMTSGDVEKLLKKTKKQHLAIEAAKFIDATYKNSWQFTDKNQEEEIDKDGEEV